jgi:hypothetical protein
LWFIAQARDQRREMVDEALGFIIVELGQEAAQLGRVAVSHLGHRRFGFVGQRDDDPPAIAFVVVAVDQSGAGELSHHEAGVRHAHVHPLGELRHGGGPGDRERDQRRDVAVSEPARLSERAR